MTWDLFMPGAQRISIKRAAETRFRSSDYQMVGAVYFWAPKKMLTSEAACTGTQNGTLMWTH